MNSQSEKLDVIESLATNRAWSTVHEWLQASKLLTLACRQYATRQVENWNLCRWLTSQIEVIWWTHCKVLPKIISWRSRYIYKYCKHYYEDHIMCTKTANIILKITKRTSWEICVRFQSVNFSHAHRPHLPPVVVCWLDVWYHKIDILDTQDIAYLVILIYVIHIDITR